MDFSQIKTSFIEHKKQILIGLGAGFVIVAIIAGLIGGNTGLFKGDSTSDAGDPLAEGEVTNVCEAVEYTGFIALLEEININIGELNDLETINIDDPAQTDAIDTLLLSLAAIVPTSGTTYTDATNCFSALEPAEAEASIVGVNKYIDKIELIKQTITAFNDARVECQAQTEGEGACEAIELDALDIAEDDLSCNADRIYNDEDSKDCVPEVLVCEYTDLYDVIKDANDLLEDFSDDPEDFGDDGEDDDLVDYLEEIKDKLDTESQDVLEDFINDFDYEDDAEDLSKILVLAANAIIEDDSELCEDLEELDQIEVSQNNNSNNNGNDEEPDDVRDLLNGGGNNSCPANASYDQLLESCLCDATNELITSSGSCPVFSSAEEDPGDSGSFVCEDGTVASDISACIALPGDGAFDNEFDPSGLPADPDDDVEIGLDDETGIDDQQLIDEAIEGINGDTQNPDNTATVTNNSQTLNSATSANVMKSGIIQGDTGPGILISVLISFLGTLTYYSFSTRKSF